MLAFLVSLQIAVAPADSTPIRPITQLVHTSWTAREGAPTQIRALAQTTDGYLWLGGSSGLVRFDGVRFVPFAPRGGDSLPSDGILSLLGARDGSLWIVWGRGMVSRVRDGRAITYGEKDGLPATFRLTESSTGTLVAATATGLAQFVDGKWNDVSRTWGYPGRESRAVWFDRENTLWAQTEDRVVYLLPGGQQFLDPGMKLRGPAAQADFAQAKDGTIWLAELFRSAHTVPRVGDQSPISEVMVGTWTLLIDRKGSLWIGSAGDGLRRVLDPTGIRGQRVAQFGPGAEQFTQKDGLLSDVVVALLEDREGNIWVASSQGLERFREGAFTPFVTPGAVRPRFVLGSRDTSVWTGAYNMYGMTRLGPGISESIQTPGFFPSNPFEDASGVLWAVHNGDILRLQGRRFIKVPVGRSEARNLVDITVDPEGTVWVFDNVLGLLRLTPDGLAPVAPLAEPAFSHSTLFSDRRGRIWIGQQNRVVLYDHGTIATFDPTKGTGAGDVLDFFEDSVGSIWAAGGRGLAKFEGGRFRTLQERQGIPGRSVYGITEDHEGAWWIVTRLGVHRLPPGEVDRALADSTYVVQHRSFDLLDGLPGVVTTRWWGPAVTRTPDGRIWVATDNGVASMDPRHLHRGVPPHVVIEALRIDGHELVASEATAIPPRSRDLEIDYTATSLAMPERIQFRYQLEGEDRTWHEVGDRRRAYYTGLSPGTYRFVVTAHNGDGVWTERGAVLNFRILPAWYQTLWFKAAVVLLIGGVGAAVAILIQRKRHWRAQEALRGQYEATLTERARIAQDLHDTLLQGFAGVTLQLKAAELALPEQPDVAAETIYRVRQLAHQSLREARERVWDMRETALGGEGLAGALETFARERTAGTGIEVALVVVGEPRRLAGPLEDAAFRIGREAVANAVRHAEARRIEIEVKFGTATVGLEVRDDGRGFTPGQGAEAHRRGHFGLSGMRDRAAHLGGHCEVLSRPGGGTVVELKLPVE